MSKPSLVVVLAEDERHQRFAWRYLERLGYRSHEVRRAPLPSGRGSGEQWVRRNYSEQVKAARNRLARAASLLIVVIDADLNEVTVKESQLRDELRQADLSARVATEPIFHLVPKRNIETWILNLATTKNLDEVTDYKADADIENSIRGAALALFDWTRGNAEVPVRCLPSLAAALPELRRLEATG